MTWVAVGVAAVGVATTVATTASKGGKQKTSQTTSQPEFPDVTRQIIQDTEFPLLQSNIQEQLGLLKQFAPGQSPFLSQQYGQGPIGTALGAAERGAKTAGVGDLGPVFENTFGLQPEFLDTLKQLVLQRGAQTKTVVGPGYGSFLAPGGQSTTTQAGASPVETGFQLASSLGQVAGGLHTSGVI